MYEVLARINGEAVAAAQTMPINDKYSDEPVANLHISTPEDIDRAIGLAVTAPIDQPLTAHERGAILQKAAELIVEKMDELVQQMRVETGFSMSDARKEVQRAAETLQLSADEARRFSGELVPFNAAPDATHRLGFTIRKPVGVVAAITPFNSPLNTVCHKVGPALAGGNTVILKPASQTPSPAVVLADVLNAAGLPSQWLHVLNGPGSSVGGAITADPRVDFIAFTGSTSVGLELQRVAGLRRTQLELGAISCTAVGPDVEMDQAAIDSCVSSSFRKAGQVCTSIQRLYVHEDVEEQVTNDVVKTAGQLNVGDPKEDDTQIGPLIARKEAERLELWIKEAVEAGAELLLGGSRHGTVLEPTILRGVRPGMRLHDEEAFGPVLCIYGYANDADLIKEMNATPYGLAAGVFTKDLGRALTMAQQLRVGTLYVNGTSSNRVDIMPYGGLKASGHGMEGPAYAVKEMSEETVVSLEWTE